MVKKRQLEKPIENEIKKWLITQGYYFYKNHGNVWTEPGRPDIQVCAGGLFIAIETKASHGGIQSEAQKFHQKRIEDNNGVYILANSLQQVEEKFEELGV